MKNNKNILILGDTFLDVFENTKFEKISPEKPVQVLSIIEKTELLGGAANVANNIKKIGGSPFLISKLSNNSTSKKIQKLLKKNKINHKLFLDDNYSSPEKRRIVSEDHQFLRVDNEQKILLKKKHEIEISNFLKKNIHKFEILVLSDYAKGFLNKYLIKTVISLFKKNKKIIITNPKSSNIKIYKGSNYICPNWLELNQSLEFFNLKANNKNVQKLIKLTNSNAYIVTKGSDGLIFYSNKKKEIYIPQKKVNIYDVTGAGDSFISFMSYLMVNKIDVINAIKFANFACSKIVQKKYTSYLSLNEFRKLIEDFCFLENLNFEKKILFWKLAKLKIGIVNGCFDIIHSGHLHLFEKAKLFCDKLIILINSDKSVKKLKGNNRPIIRLNERIKFLNMIKCIDQIISFDEDTPVMMIKKIIPDILFKGSDYKKEDVAGFHFLTQRKKRVKIIRKYKNFSSSKLANL